MFWNDKDNKMYLWCPWHTWGNKVQNGYFFCLKVTIEVKRLLTLVTFERLSLVECTMQSMESLPLMVQKLQPRLKVFARSRHSHRQDKKTELQIIFESNAYLPPNFWRNADYQNLKLYCHPLYFFAMHKREGITVLKRKSVVLCRFKHRFGSDLQWFAIACGIILQKNCFCNITYHNANHWQYVDKRTDRWTSSIQSFTFLLILPISTHCFGHLMRTTIC